MNENDLINKLYIKDNILDYLPTTIINNVDYKIMKTKFLDTQNYPSLVSPRNPNQSRP